MARVPADSRENAGKSFRELNRTGAARQIGPDANDFVDAGCLCPLDDLGQVIRVVGKIEMCMSVVKIGHKVRVEWGVREIRRPKSEIDVTASGPGHFSFWRAQDNALK